MVARHIKTPGIARRALRYRVGMAGFPATPLTEPDLWTTHPALWVGASVTK
jgi:hypothetical protein